MSVFGKKFALHVATDTIVREPDVPVDGGLERYGGFKDPPDDRRSHTAILLDSLAEICVSRPGEVYAVGLAVPVLDKAAVQFAVHEKSIPAPCSKIAPTLVVAANQGVPKATRTYLKDVLEHLRDMAETEVASQPTTYEPFAKSPRRENFGDALGNTLLLGPCCILSLEA